MPMSRCKAIGLAIVLVFGVMVVGGVLTVMQGIALSDYEAARQYELLRMMEIYIGGTEGQYPRALGDLQACGLVGELTEDGHYLVPARRHVSIGSLVSEWTPTPMPARDIDRIAWDVDIDRLTLTNEGELVDKDTHAKVHLVQLEYRGKVNVGMSMQASARLYKLIQKCRQVRPSDEEGDCSPSSAPGQCQEIPR